MSVELAKLRLCPFMFFEDEALDNINVHSCQNVQCMVSVFLNSKSVSPWITQGLSFLFPRYVLVLAVALRMGQAGRTSLHLAKSRASETIERKKMKSNLAPVAVWRIESNTLERDNRGLGGRGQEG